MSRESESHWSLRGQHQQGKAGKPAYRPTAAVIVLYARHCRAAWCPLALEPLQACPFGPTWPAGQLQYSRVPALPMCTWHGRPAGPEQARVDQLQLSLTRLGWSRFKSLVYLSASAQLKPPPDAAWALAFAMAPKIAAPGSYGTAVVGSSSGAAVLEGRDSS